MSSPSGFYGILRVSVESFRIADADVADHVWRESVKERIEAVANHPDLLETVTKDIGAQQDTIVVFFSELAPIVHRSGILHDEFIEDDPGEIDEQGWVLLEQALDHLPVVRRMDPSRCSAVSEDHLELREVTQHHLHLMEIFRMIRYSRRGDIVVDEHRKVVFHGELEDRIHGTIVDPTGFSGCQEGEIVMSEEHLSDSSEDSRIELEHLPDMMDGIHIHRVEPADERIEPLAILLIQRHILQCDHRIRGEVVIALGIVIQIILRRAPLILGPHLPDRHSENDRFADSRLIHVIDQILKPLGFPPEIEGMQVGIDHLVPAPHERFEELDPRQEFFPLL